MKSSCHRSRIISGEPRPKHAGGHCFATAVRHHRQHKQHRQRSDGGTRTGSHECRGVDLDAAARVSQAQTVCCRPASCKHTSCAVRPRRPGRRPRRSSVCQVLQAREGRAAGACARVAGRRHKVRLLRSASARTHRSADRPNARRLSDRLSIQCLLSPTCTSLPPFETAAAYEAHYDAAHVNVCSQCHRILPTDHLLHLHLLEVHDSYFAVLASRQHSYECFVEGCPRKSLTPKARSRHLVDVHKYPPRFDFDVVLGLAGPLGSSMQKRERRRPKAAKDHNDTKDHKDTKENHQGMDGVEGTGTQQSHSRSEEVQDDAMSVDALAQSMSKLAFVPRSVSFGRRGKARTGFGSGSGSGSGSGGGSGKVSASFAAVKEAHLAHAPKVAHTHKTGPASGVVAMDVAVHDDAAAGAQGMDDAPGDMRLPQQ
ncbi:hypothetical protein BC831DRAFT_396552 [Entophlyctis helioformis]|nr:hypothetical protein BC831DRAFT_396552 [Entophlyctis helioformis]